MTDKPALPRRKTSFTQPPLSVTKLVAQATARYELYAEERVAEVKAQEMANRLGAPVIIYHSPYRRRVFRVVPEGNKPWRHETAIIVKQPRGKV